jgi:hypothetical protein
MTSQSELRHIPEETLEQYCMGRLSESETEPVEEHLLFCTLCQDTLTETEEFLRVVQSAASRLESQPGTEVWWTRLWRAFTTLPKPIFALAACALALFVIVPNQSRNSAVVELKAMRGAETATQAPARTKLILRVAAPAALAATPQANLELRIVNLDGAIVTQVAAQQTADKIVADIEGLPAGSYWVRLYSGQQIAGEYGITVR